MARQQARRHHRERVIGAALAVLGLIVAGVALYALHQPNGHNTAAASPSVTTTRTVVTSAPARSSSSPQTSASRSGLSLKLGSSTKPNPATSKKTPLIVLNDTTTSGLAATASDRFEAGGWTVTSHDNLPSGISDIVSTCAYYDPSSTGSQSAADALRAQFPTIKRVQPRFVGLPDGPVVVVLTPDYSSG